MTSKAKVVAKLAHAGSRIIGRVCKKMGGSVFNNLQETLERPRGGGYSAGVKGRGTCREKGLVRSQQKADGLGPVFTLP